MSGGDNITVTTLVGSGEAAWKDGIGKAAALRMPFDICQQITDSASSFLICDTGTNRIRRLFTANTQWRAALTQTITSAAADSFITPLTSMIVDYLIGEEGTLYHTLSLDPFISLVMGC